MNQATLRIAKPKSGMSAAERLVRSSYDAQAQLVGNGVTHVIPAMAESPIPVLEARNRTPNPRNRVPLPRAPMARP